MAEYLISGVGSRAWSLRTARVVQALLALLVFFTANACAQDAPPGAGVRYFSHVWLWTFILNCVFWLAVFDWMGRDAEKLRIRHQMWAGLALLVGAVGMALMLLVHIVLVFFSFLALGTLFGIYVFRRNQLVPPGQKVFTPQHIAYLFRSLSAKLKLTKGAAMRVREGAADATEIVLLRKDGATLEKITQGRGVAEASEAVLSIKELVESAVLSRSTDIHLEPKEGELQARFRIDGILHNVPSYPSELAAPMISSVKVLSDMDITEKRKPQDGTFMGRLSNRNLDFRVSTAPSVHGETMVIRVLDRAAGLINAEKLGFNEKDLTTLRKVINYPHGMLIVSGPTGSGKSTSLYAMLSEIDAYQKNILTIEDPIEYRLDNVTQTQVNPKAGVTFAGALRSSLRQDPDVIMVGEIRDAETARVALQAAMTGHFVFSTVHANDAVTSLFRLLDLGVEPYLIASALSAVLAQRLLRVLCEECKEPYIPDAAFLARIGVRTNREIQLYKAVGCDQCQGTGYRGRIGIFEFFELNDVIRDLVRENPSIQLIKAEARKLGMRKLQEDGLSKVLRGITSVKELVRVSR